MKRHLKRRQRGFLFLFALLMAPVLAASTVRADDFEPWLRAQFQRSLNGMLQNINPPGSVSGTVAASPSTSHPNYFYHWVRDAGLVMDTVAMLYAKPDRPDRKGMYYNALLAYADRARKLQDTPSRNGQIDMGEAHFTMGGTAYLPPWADPQYDGPALRALSLIHFAQVLLSEGHEDVVRARLYDSAIPSATPIKNDLEFVAHMWPKPCFDLWEETFGFHFYTRMVQRRALLEGAALAQRLGDPGAARAYSQQAALISTEIQKHWDPARGYIVETLGCGQQCRSASGLDIAVLLGSLHGCAGDGFFCPGSDQILATAAKLRDAFGAIYGINKTLTDPSGATLGVALGRYPEDKYDGYESGANTLGNPWFLSTHALAEIYYRAGREWARQGAIRITPAKAALLGATGFRARLAGNLPAMGAQLAPGTPVFNLALQATHQAGDEQLRRSKFHIAGTGGFSEQFNRNSGFEQGAPDLTWSYASFLTAIWYR